jgi:hypothetical protein
MLSETKHKINWKEGGVTRGKVERLQAGSQVENA